MRQIIFSLYFFACWYVQLTAQNVNPNSTNADRKRWRLQSISAAYAGENLIRPGIQFSVDFIPVKKRKSELVVSPVATFFVFRPFYTAVLLGGRAMYHIHFPSGITLRPVGINTSYKHKFLMASVYEADRGSVDKLNDIGYGNFHLLVTTGIAYNFSDRSTIPLTIFTDFGVSVEPYFGIYKFHYELYIGISYHLN